jgi:hypothetical protein
MNADIRTSPSRAMNRRILVTGTLRRILDSRPSEEKR